MSAQYKNLLKILDKWPIDKTKPGRDLGEYLRKEVNTLLARKTIDAELDSLTILVHNVHGNKYPRKLQSTATGLTGEQCKQVLSAEFLQYINEDQGVFKK